MYIYFYQQRNYFVKEKGKQYNAGVTIEDKYTVCNYDDKLPFKKIKVL